MNQERSSEREGDGIMNNKNKSLADKNTKESLVTDLICSGYAVLVISYQLFHQQAERSRMLW